MKDTIRDILDHQDKLSFSEFVGDSTANGSRESDEIETSDQAEVDEEDKIVPLTEADEQFEGIHPNHLSQVRRMVGNAKFTKQRSVSQRFAGEE